jgi:hypothetical protein
MDLVKLAALFALLFPLLALPVAAQQNTGQAQMPRPSDELVALSRIPLLEIRVTDAAGQPIRPRVYVNWRGLPNGLSGGGATDATGRFLLTANLQGSVSTGWRVTPTGPHRIEIVTDGYKSHVIESVNLQAGRTTQIAVTLERRAGRTFLEPDVYKRRAAELVLSRTTATKKAQGQVRVIGEPVMLPEPTTQSALEPRNFPEAYVLTAIYVNGRFREPAVVWFEDGIADMRFSYTGGDFLPLEEQEWRDVAAMLDGFYATAVDVTRGPERFYEYLPEDMRQMLDLPAEKNRMWVSPDAVKTLANDQLRRFAASAFDHWILTAWAALHHLPWPANPIRPADIRRDPVAVTASLQTANAAMRRVLREAGVLTPERMASGQMYVRRMLGEGYMVREDPDRDGIRKLPRGARMYTVMLGAPLPHVIIDRGKLRIVAVDFF